MEKDIIRIIASGIIAFKYALLGWAIWILVSGTSDGLVILSTLLVYWYWMFVATLTLVLTALFSGMVPPKTQQQKDEENQIITELFKEVPILKFLEGNLIVSRILSFGTVAIVLVLLSQYQMHTYFQSLILPAAIAAGLSIVLKIKEN